MTNSMKKLISLSILMGFIIHPFLASATSPTIDPGTVGNTAADTATNATTTSQEILATVKEYGLDQVAYMLAQKIGQKMATASINKATGGASGDKDPNYVKDFGTIFSNIEQQQKDLYTTKLLTSGNPFARDIAKEMLSSNNQGLSQFSLGSVLQNGGDWKAAKNNLSTAGIYGYDFYSQLAFPANTPLGAKMIAREELANQTIAKKETEKLKLGSSGFLPNAKCNTSIASYKNNVNALIGSSESQEFDTPEQAAAYNEANAQQQSATMGSLVGDTAGCIDEMIKNPVATTQVLTNEAGKFGMDMTKNIQGWGQIVAGLFVSLFNGFVDKGLSSLKADYGQVKASNVGGPEQLNQMATGGTGQTLVNFAASPINIIDLREEFEKSLTITQENINAINAMRTELIKVPTRLAYLDICIPGPDQIGLEKRMDDYYSQQTGWIQKKSAMGSDEKRNTYQEIILSMLEQDFAIAKAETQQDTIDDSRNIPGIGPMRVAINRFNTRRPLWTSSLDSLVKSNDTMSQLRKVNTDLKLSLAHLKNAEPTQLANVPVDILPFTQGEWDTLLNPDGSLSVQNNTLYTWASTHTPPTTPITTAAAKRDYVIKTVWDLWENPETFLSTGKWSDLDPESETSQKSKAFLDEKNIIRSQFSSLSDSIPTDWELSKNEQLVESVKGENLQTDKLIHDCDKMRELIWGNTVNESGWLISHPGQGADALLTHMIQNKDTLFLSDEVKNSLTLPNILNTNRSWADDSCRPDADVVYEAGGNTPSTTGSSGKVYGDHAGGYACYGNFGHLYNIEGSEGCDAGCDFNEWIDAASNIYQSQTHIGWPTELYYKSRIIQFIPDTSTYGTGWKMNILRNGNQMADGGYSRGLFCRLSSVLAIYGARSGSPLDRDSKEIRCSSKWTDLSISEAIASFITNQVK